MATSEESALEIFTKMVGVLNVLYYTENIKRVERHWLGWLGNIVQVDKNTSAMKVFDAVADG